MEQRIQYTTTEDGVRIAYTVAGSGPPLLYQPGYPFNHLKAQMEFDWSMPQLYEHLADRCTLIRFDHRATGLSQRDRLPSSQDDLVADVEAVVSAVGLTPLSLAGWAVGGGIVGKYASRHPEAVSALVLADTSARPIWAYGDTDVARVRTLMNMAPSDWELFTETVARVYLGWEEGKARDVARYFRECTSPDTIPALDDITEDLTGMYRRLRKPTLVIKHQDGLFPPMEGATELAALVEGAELVVLDGVWITTEERAARYADTILDFIGAGEKPKETPAPAPSAFRTVLFTDLVGHTEMMSRLGDAQGREVLREHERLTREVLSEHGGTEVKTMGDGFLASFGSVTKAVECAVALQRRFAERNESADEALVVRVGLNAGEPIEEKGDLFGATVILAARIAARADGGEILVGDTVRGLCSGKGFPFADRGEFAAKGFEDPVRLFEVGWREDG